MGRRSRITGIRHPEGFHHQGPGSFEGWYVKLVTADREHRWAVIPGIFRGQDGSRGGDEAFVQVLDGRTGASSYHRFDPAEFHAATDRFDVQVGPNRFRSDGVELHLPELAGEVRFASPLDPWRVWPWAPGAMGWYAWVPAMECYHQVVSFGHALSGTLRVEDGEVDFAGGRGYLEKDWGTAFPAGYIWLHSNTFAHTDASLMASSALIPWRGRQFRGFIVGLRHGGRLYRFATYTRARSLQMHVDDDSLVWRLRSARRPGRTPLSLEVRADRPAGGLLHAPIRTEMHRRVEETLDARIEVTLRRGSEVLLNDVGLAGGLEVHGDIPGLLATDE